MPHDDLGKDVAGLSIADDGDNIETAAKRLAREAEQAVRFGRRGVEDVTEKFTAASKLLPPGRLVKDEFFTLFDSVGALEIMDAKMDSGFVPPGDSFEAEFDPCGDLDAEQVIWIMDRLLSLEVTWLDGYPLAQTVYTSLHIDRILSPANKKPYSFPFGRYLPPDLPLKQALVHFVLHTFCLGLIKSCQLALFWIKSQTFFEEEDFVTHLYGRELIPGLGTEIIHEALSCAMGVVDRLELDSELKRALRVRLEFREYYLTSTEFAAECWDKELPEALREIGETSSLAKPVPEAFSEKVQRQLASSTPPRPMVSVSWEETMKKWNHLFKDMHAASSILLSTGMDTPHCFQRATWVFAYRDPPPGTFARAHMQDLLFDQQALARQLPHYELLLSDLRNMTLAGDVIADPESFQIELTSDPRHIWSRIMEEFLDKALEEYLNLYRMVCQNRCRMRRTFAQAIAIWDALETEAAKTDEKLHTAWPRVQTTVTTRVTQEKVPFKALTTWARYYRLQIMAWTIQLGFETDIYLPHELAGMYWYLHHVTIDELTVFYHTEQHLLAYHRAAGLQSADPGVIEIRFACCWVKSLYNHRCIVQDLAVAFWHLYTLLTGLSIIPTPKRDYAQTQMLHETRFKSFLPMTNSAVPSLEEFESVCVLSATLRTACAATKDEIRNVKEALAEFKTNTTPIAGQYVGTETEWKAEIKKLETSCVAIAVAVSQILQIAEKHGKLDATGGDDLSGIIVCEIPPPGPKRYHDWWIVPVIREATGT